LQLTKSPSETGKNGFPRRVRRKEITCAPSKTEDAHESKEALQHDDEKMQRQRKGQKACETRQLNPRAAGTNAKGASHKHSGARSKDPIFLRSERKRTRLLPQTMQPAELNTTANGGGRKGTPQTTLRLRHTIIDRTGNEDDGTLNGIFNGRKHFQSAETSEYARADCARFENSRGTRHAASRNDRKQIRRPAS